jgi:NodT family efflux transporter outer membrane factor (OMF) lipoprotein
VRSNQTIIAADAQYRSALAAVGGARAALLPTVGIAAATTRSSNGTASLPSVGGTTLPGGATYTTDRLTGSVNWEIDLWGRLRRGLEVSRTAAQASAGDLAAVQLSVTATLAQDYVQLRSLDTQRDLFARTIAAYRRSLEITRNRYAAGVAPRTDVTEAESQLAGAEAQDADLSVQRAALEHAIATLTGRSATEFGLPPATALPKLPPVPRVLPATLLERRPDVAAAERRVASANAAVGVARGAWFPSLSLSGSGGYQAREWQHLIALPNRLWSLGPTLAETLFDAGARSAQSAGARADYDRAVATYRQTVLTALADAEDALAALRGLADEEAAENRAAVAARETLRATENQYRAGTVSYLNVVIAQSTAFAADRSLIDVQGRRLLAHIGLLKAMGGAPSP